MKNKRSLRLLFLLFICSTINGNLFAQRKKTPPTKVFIIGKQAQNSAAPAAKLSPESERRLESFRLVWQVIKDNYFDQTFSGLNWDNIKKEYEPRVLQTASDKQLYDILQEMINRLNRSHFAIIPPEVYKTIENAKAQAKAGEKSQNAPADAGGDKGDEAKIEDEISSKYGIGVELRLIDNQFVITRIDPNSAAEKAGLKTGFVIEKINNVSLKELLDKIEIYYPNLRTIKKFLPLEVAGWFLNGDKDTTISVSYLDAADQPREIQIKREKLDGKLILIGNNFPVQFFNFETKSLDENVGYVRFNFFALPVIEKFCSALTEFKNKKAIIIDLRGNLGGLIGTVVGISGMMTDKQIDLGTQIYKIGSENLLATAKAKNFKGRIVFLVDNLTVSAAEMFAASLQENNRALVVGEKTAGEALPSISVSLPTGAVLLYPIANYKTHDGNYLEGKGVEPNFIVNRERKSLLEGKDNQLETALKIIKEDTAFPKSIPEDSANKITVNNEPPLPLPKAKVLGAVNIKIPAPIAEKEPKEIKDEKSLRIIADFINKIGGEEALRGINSYALNGTAELKIKGTVVKAEISLYRQKPDRYSEIMKSESLGEIREVFNGKNHSVQTDYGVNRDFPLNVDTTDVEIFSPINNLLDKNYFKSLTFQGVFERQGRKTNIIEAKTSENFSAALAFDAETKLLVSYALQYSTISLGDYRKVENLLLPFSIARENIMSISLDEIKLNPAIEENNFKKKENCYDKPD
ncbi:MAG: S41 family peptidase [Pyrinomonadaceae bacterium]